MVAIDHNGKADQHHEEQMPRKGHVVITGGSVVYDYWFYCRKIRLKIN